MKTGFTGAGNVRHTLHPPRFDVLFDNSSMRSAPEELSVQSPEQFPGSNEGRVIESEESGGLRGAAEDLMERQKAKINAQRNEIVRLRSRKVRYAKQHRGAKKRIVKLEREIWRASKAHQETSEKQDQRIQAMGDRLARTKELLTVRSAELAGAQSFLSTTDRLSEAEVLDIVRDLNENVFQVAANLTEEWEKFGSSRSSRFPVFRRDFDSLCQFYGSALVQPAFGQKPAAVTFLVQSCLCRVVTQITSSWRRRSQELATLGSVYQRLSASGEHTSHAINGM